MLNDGWEALMTSTNGISDLKCGVCGHPMILRAGVHSKQFYGCTRWPNCTGSHGAHPDGSPMGVPADAKTMLARRRGHAALETYRNQHGRNKNQCYRWLAQKMNLTRKECHFGLFNYEQCEQAIMLLTNHSE